MELHRTLLSNLKWLISQALGQYSARDHGAIYEDWTALECIRLLYWRRVTILWITGIGAAAAALVSSGQPYIYESHALLEIESYNEQFLNLHEIYSITASRAEADLSMQTQAELLQQDSLLEEVAQKLRLRERPEFQPPSSLLWKLHEAISIAPVRGSRLIQIDCDDTDASVAADFANALAQTFIEHEIQAQQQNARGTYDGLLAQLKAGEGRVVGNNYQLSPALIRMALSAATKRGPNESVLHALRQKANAAKLGAMMNQSNVRLAAPAVLSSSPYRPNLPLNLAIGTLGGFVLGIGVVLLHEQNVLTFREPHETRACLGVPELGVIPNGDGLSLFCLAAAAGKETGPAVRGAAVQRRASWFLDSFRSVAASIFLMKAGRSRVLAFTSSHPKEGKTTVVSNLGVALAEMGSKVLLIDGEIRQPQLHRIFGQINDWGWTDYLHAQNANGETPLELRVKATPVPGLFLLPRGTRNNEIFPSLCADQTSLLLSRLCRDFDYVLIDAPPFLELAGAGQITKNADGLVLVVRANCTARMTIHTFMLGLPRCGPRVVGFILNRFVPLRGDSYLDSSVGSNPPQEDRC
jgi:polysaccharide biosynthesis transport protein